jgi:peptidoglycan/LPS O-acetylase OafA/YrhL
VQGLAGVAILTLAATTLGLPLSGGHLATDLLLVILGYKMTTRLRQGQYEDRNIVRFWLGHLGRVGVPMLVALGLTVTYWSWTGVVTTAQRQAVLGALTLNLNIVDGLGGSHFEAIEHLRLVALISQFALVLPILLFVCHKIRPIKRAALLFSIGVVALVARIGLLTTGTAAGSGDLLAGLLRVDGLLIGAAIAVTPLPILRRLMPSQLAAPLFAGLLLAFVAAPGSPSSAGIVAGLAAWITMVLSTALVSAAAGGGLVGSLSVAVDGQHMRWLGARTLSILIWHQLIGYIFLGIGVEAGTTPDAAPDMDEWPGMLVFTVRIVFTLAAAATSHRYLELPLAGLARQFARRSQPEDATATESVGAEQQLHPSQVAERARPKPPPPVSVRESTQPTTMNINHPTLRPLRLSTEAHPSMSGNRR